MDYTTDTMSIYSSLIGVRIRVLWHHEALNVLREHIRKNGAIFLEGHPYERVGRAETYWHEEQRKQIIVTRKGMLDPLEVHLLDFPNVVTKEVTTNASVLSLRLLVDEYIVLHGFLAFDRLILRTLHVNNEKANMLLKPDATVVTKPHQVWPSHTDDQRMKVEVALRDLTLSDYAKKNNVNTSALIQSVILLLELRLLHLRNNVSI
ncbi:hypothetical protein MKW98_007408 [Papaver atlanticum]|uniref:PRP8 domain-containing protein n=1 Tax=Papaver atlanticum TaxID=357466 RepID=A0AAD4SBN9_9MAGN|nr:hypothetical protein MKW98_007408 [Papaver atlanticum]